MRLLFIRHGDPDYANDTLTEKGHREAALLAETAIRLNMGDCYVSPLGRAKDTAAYSLKMAKKTAKVLDWLEEFPSTVDINNCQELKNCYPDTKMRVEKFALRIPWDMLPSYWTAHPEYMDRFAWRDSMVASHSNITSDYDRATAAFDKLLADYGYLRDGDHYQTEIGCEQTLTFFCHFGITCAILSHLFHVSPFILWHTLALAPSSVTEVVTEEREPGLASFRALRLGDQSHLCASNEPPSFACRFCETYGAQDQRH